MCPVLDRNPSGGMLAACGGEFQIFCRSSVERLLSLLSHEHKKRRAGGTFQPRRGLKIENTLTASCSY